MADKEEKMLPIREQEDGTVLVAVEEEKDPFENQEKDAKASDSNTDSDASDDDNDGDSESAVDAAADDDNTNDGETEEDREKIREARREERKLKKELAKQREASSKHKISALERRNEELARRLAAVESAATSFQFAQVDKAIEDEATRVEYSKMKLLQASQSGNAEEQVEYLEQLQEAKTRLAQMQAYKKQQVAAAARPKQNVPNPVSSAVQENASAWLSKNKWFDPQARDTDSRIAKVVDQEMADEGWDPSDPEYWDELDNRLTSRLPHRYAAKSGGSAGKSRPNPTASSRSANPSATPANAIRLSPERVRAIKDAGAWDDPASRNRMIKAYMAYDKQNRT